jgi:hypothetical protein
MEAGVFVERRRKRSNYAGLALQYYLASVARQKQLFALVVADPSGLLVASSFRGPEAEELAAVAPLIARPDEGGESVQERGEIPIVIHKLSVEHASLFLCAVGDKERSRQGLRTVAGGVRRILATP